MRQGQPCTWALGLAPLRTGWMAMLNRSYKDPERPGALPCADRGSLPGAAYGPDWAGESISRPDLGFAPPALASGARQFPPDARIPGHPLPAPCPYGVAARARERPRPREAQIPVVSLASTSGS